MSVPAAEEPRELPQAEGKLSLSCHASCHSCHVKDAAGVISLSNKATEQSGVLYAFPPCNFSLDLLRRVSGDLSDEGSKDDHLVVVVVKGG